MGTWIVGLILIAIVVGIIRDMVRKKFFVLSSICGGSCGSCGANCPYASHSHDQQQKQPK